jgi:hypothetical protein
LVYEFKPDAEYNIYNMRENWDYRSEIPTLNGEFLRWEIRSRKTKIYTNVWRLAGLGKRRDKNVVFIGYGKINTYGEKTEYCKLGTFQVLTALTAVSYQARNSMYWLYETLF